MKLDTQGYDKFVFDGSKGCLNNIIGLQSELSLIPIYDGILHSYDLLKEFHSHGFFISKIFPLNNDESSTVIEYDSILIGKQNN